MRRFIFILFLALMLTLVTLPAQNHPRMRIFQATAYAQGTITKSGLPVRPGLVAADPDVLPLGTRIHVANAGPYSGVYTVADTGSAVRGHIIDIFIPSLRQAKIFGRKLVHVTVLSWGEPRAERGRS